MPRLLALLLLPCVLLLSSCKKAEETKPNGDNAAANPAPQGQQVDEKKDREGIFGKTTAEIVDMKKAMAENPNLKVFERHGLGNDPLSQYMNAYAYVRSETQMLNMKHEMDLMKAMNDDRYLSYEEFMKFVKKYNFQFVMLKRWQKYGYDEGTGNMVILQDEAEKKRIYEENDLDYQEGTL